MPRHIKAKPEEMNKRISPFVGKAVLKIYVKEYAPKNLKWEVIKDGKITYEPYDDKFKRERGDYTKVFRSSENRLRKAKLSPLAAHLLHWIMEKTDSGKDYITIDVKSYINESARTTKEGKPIKLSRNTYKIMIDELCDQSFLSKTSKSETYFINPSLFFNGSRTKRFPENIEYL